MKRLLWISGLALSSCAVTASEGMLASITSPKTLDTAYLERQCDVEDAAACYFLRGRLPALPRVPIVQGLAGEDRAVFVVELGPLAEVRYFLRQKEDQSVRALPVAKVITRESSAWRLERIELSKLEADKTYELLVTDRTGQLIDVRSFKPLREKPEAFRFAIFSGTEPRAAAPGDPGLWKSLLDRRNATPKPARAFPFSAFPSSCPPPPLGANRITELRAGAPAAITRTPMPPARSRKLSSRPAPTRRALTRARA
jgi:hypothetical protein